MVAGLCPAPLNPNSRLAGECVFQTAPLPEPETPQRPNAAGSFRFALDRTVRDDGENATLSSRGL